MYRLNGVKVAGPDFDVKTCDFIEAKKEERKQHERDVARAKGGSTPAPKKQEDNVKDLLGRGYFHLGGH